MLRKIPYYFILLLLSTQSIAQSSKIDSIKKVISGQSIVTEKVNSLLSLSREFYSISPEEAINYATTARDLAQKAQYKNGLAYAYKNLGIAYYMLGNYVVSIENYERSLALFDSLNDKAGVANILSNEGSVFFNKGDDEKALELNLKALRVSEEIGDTLRILTALQNIGAVYYNKPSTRNQAIEYFLRALPMSELLKNNDAIGTITVNIGELYLLKGNYDSALIYFKKSLVAYKGSENIPYTLNDIGKVYQKRKDYQTAISYHQQAFDISEKLNAKVDMGQSLLGLGDTYMGKGDASTAIGYYKRSEVILKEISDATYDLENAYKGLAAAYASKSDFKNAFKYETLFTSVKDSLYNLDIAKKLSSLQFNFDIQKKQSQIDLLKKDQVLQELDLKKQKLTKNALMIGLALLSLIAVILYRNYRNKIKTNKLLDAQKVKIENLLLNILPAEVAEELQKNGTATPRFYKMASVLFTDFKGFTKLSEKLTPQEVISELDIFFMAFDDIVDKYGLEKIKTIGDSYMCAGGIPTEDNSHPLNIVKAGLEMQEFILKRNAERAKMNLPEWNIRIGINTGQLVAGVVGKKKYAYDIWGSTVNVASRMESNGEPGRVNISSATYELIKDKYSCTHRGKIFAKNIGEVDMYFVEDEIHS
ncbi:adenylate/guanylate cyclase domain-containing protein [Hanamia caeni]|jgi:class 3 adenylate cyclase|uniref:Adenylate/guanylate cyclase domain-containing protein n=1 Tax=Hanamia caeni TaxID=2294116 RepID=A0A3M9NQW6_9BACT|nr:adenylate/guanylate cyclase domain-containing protein [Hanamia caeni]RNI40212.1 adenylate/guanylate cyclase domain-containing protein [Hanamia caeni]